MADQDPPMPPANDKVWLGISFGGTIFLAIFMAWAAIFGISGVNVGTSGQQQASGALQQTTGQAAPAQQQQQK